jgi:ribosomal protein S12 methylthiotransferase accessory factor
MTTTDVRDQYRSALSRYGEVVAFELTGLDRTGVPVTSCSLIGRESGRFEHHGNGYGATVEAAEISGLGELAEGVLAARQVRALGTEAIAGSFRELLAAQGADRVVDPRILVLPAGSPWTEDMPLTWLPVRRVRTDETVYVPAEFVANETGDFAGDTPLVQPITNGLGAGLDPVRPITHGLGELLQRHTNGLRFRALDRLSPVIDPAGLPPRVAALVDRLRAVGITAVLKHAATDLGVVSIYAAGLDDDPPSRIMLTANGEAAHPDAETSAVKALLEYANSRARKAFCFGSRDAARTVAPADYWQRFIPSAGEARATAEMQRWAALSTDELRALTAPDTSRSVTWASIVPGTAPPADQPALLAHLLTALAEHDVLTTAIDIDGVVVAKTVVPGLEVETLSYGRIGEFGVRSALAADLDLVRVQDGPSESHPDRVVLTTEAQERLGGPVWFSWAAVERIVGPRYPMYREPPRHSVQV